MFHCWMIGRRRALTSTVKRSSGVMGFVYFLIGALAICHAPPPALADGDVNEQMTKALNEPAPAPPRSPATIFVAREVITMEPGNPSGDAVAVSGKPNTAE